MSAKTKEPIHEHEAAVCSTGTHRRLLILCGTTPAGAAVSAVSDDPTSTASIVVNTDGVGAAIAADVEPARLSVGTVPGTPTLLFRRQIFNMGTMTGEGGGGGVSDVLELDSFLSAAGATLGFRATFESDS